jgi:prephenate dehydratase
MTKKIAIQGIEGSFHHIVGLEFYTSPIKIECCLSFDDVVDAITSNICDEAVMAIENSIAGSIIPNYARIDQNNLQIKGEYYLNIQHNLMALAGQSIEDIKEVHSHPMALLQCKRFFDQHPHLKLVEAKDTADVAKTIARESKKGIAAIASLTAGKLFDLNILQESIQTVEKNQTRFVILSNKKQTNHIDTEFNKASLKFELDHKRGSLATVLNVMSDCKLNLTKIQSLPKIEKPWKYAFFVDTTFETYKDFEKAISIIKIMAEEFKILGVYKNAKS